ncbi:SDR family oxidoreductase [Bosea sp. RAF48]|uniref:SDR family oxidoreductase n=1 Tax=Bosea sp. RAF48 TaxID=3237480 RepID=UPI003F93A324
MTRDLVLVTGGSGFVAGHCILKLLAAGFDVRATLRSSAREGRLREALKGAGVDAGERLQIAAADLMQDEGWDAAMTGCSHVLHVASPLASAAPRDEDELIRPAREGTLRVLRAARRAGVRRVVLTSSFAAIGYGRALKRPYDERDWTNPAAPGLAAYPKSKTLAELAAWDFVDGEGQGLELAVVNPVGVFGPLLGPDLSASILLVKTMLEGRLWAVPRLMFGVVDVRDVADLHLRAMTDPAAAGERFLATAGDFMTMQAIAQALKDGLGERAGGVSTRVLPDWLVRLAARFSATARQAATPELGRVKNATSAKAQAMLGWQPRPAAEALVATGESLLRLGLVSPPRP